jgi:hypothetical protein
MGVDLMRIEIELAALVAMATLAALADAALAVLTVGATIPLRPVIISLARQRQETKDSFPP